MVKKDKDYWKKKEKEKKAILKAGEKIINEGIFK